MRTIISLDIGGTQLRAAIYKHGERKPIAQKKIKTQSQEPDTFGRLLRLIEEIMPAGMHVDAIGASCPGPVDPHTGVIMFTPNIKEWRDFPFSARLMKHFGVPAFVDNDANLAGLAEWKFGAGRGHHYLLYITVSTGIGGGVVINDRLLQGARGMAAEVGHMTILAGGPRCGCGQAGHLEALSSGTGIERHVAEQLAAGRPSLLDATRRNSARDIADAARRGDELSLEAYQLAGKYLGIGVASLLHIINPTVVVFGGGVSQSGPLLFDPFDISLKQHIIHPRYLEGLVIARAELGDDSGLLGARALAEMKLDS